MTTNIFLTILGASLLSGLVASLLTWRHFNGELITARTERRAAQYELAEQIAGFDRYAAERDKWQEKADAEYNALYDRAEQYNADADAWWRAYVAADNARNELSEYIRERGMHDDAVAAAHDAEVVDPFDVDLPALAAVDAECPVSPAPAWDFTGSWKTVDTSRALEAAPAYVGAHRMQDAA